jgi:hypothetical protein
MMGFQKPGSLPAGFPPAPRRTAAPAALVAETPAASATATLGFRTGFVHIDGPAPEHGSVEGSDGAVRFGGIRHFDEGKSARLAGVAVADQADPIDHTVLFEKRAYGFLGDTEIQVANKNILHLISLRMKAP